MSNRQQNRKPAHKYIETGVEELDQEELPILLTNKYQSLEDAKDILPMVGVVTGHQV